MPFTCVVPGCNDKSSTMHRLPNPNKSLVKYNNWLDAIGNVQLHTLDPLKVYLNYRICHQHFEVEDLSTNMHLKPAAIPTLFLPTRNTSQKNPEYSPIAGVLEEPFQSSASPEEYTLPITKRCPETVEILQEEVLEKPLSSTNDGVFTKEITMPTIPSTSKSVFNISKSRSSVSCRFGPDMEKQAEICETYQLKWSSYNSYFLSCIATSLQSDSFADVALVTTDGHQIMAHRFVLSYSSQFLSQILKFQPKVTTALPLMIVMPPEIDYKSLKVLVRYMYSGEAKVSKDILNNVLKGGDILQIKGLYREKEDKNSQSSSQNTQKITTTTTTSTNLTTASTSDATQSVVTKTASNTLKRPKIVPVVNQEKTPTTPTQTKFLVLQKAKDTQQYANTRPKVLNFTLLQKFDKTNQNAKDDGSKHMTILNKSLDSNIKSDSDQASEQVTIKTEPGSTKESNLQYLMIKDEPIEWTDADMELIDSKEVFDDMTIKSENTEQYESESAEEESMFSPLTCELCTETFTIPAEWVRHVQTHTDMLPAKRRRRDSPGDTYENDTFPELTCDLCQKSFPTPAEWVRHIQDTHTEFELHLSNKQNPNYKPSMSLLNDSHGSEMSKKCVECDKTFPSHASMVIHRRRHTGEKPYSCEYCKKNFNVKSNLLRHLRTLHNKIINSTDVDNKEILSDNSN